MRAWDLATGSPWAITEDALRTILAIAKRENLNPEAVEARLGRALANTRTVTVRDGVATIPVVGPLFRYANLFTRVSGATSVEVLATDLAAALDNPEVAAIILNVDSPGGEANGVSELAQMIRAAADRKPVVSYVGGAGASGGYWLASAAPTVVVSDIGLLGSIGVVVSVDAASDPKTVEIVSSQSPRKRPDVATDEGRAQLQELVDALAQVFVEAVAGYRGIAVKDVLAVQGGMVVGAAAVKAGLADQVGTYEATHAALAAAVRAGTAAPGMGLGRLAGPVFPRGIAAAAPAAGPITLERLAADQPDLVRAIRTEGASAERDRILSIGKLRGKGQDAVVAACQRDPECSPGDAALRVLTAREEDAASDARIGLEHLAALEADEAALEKPGPGTGDPREMSADERDAARILGAAAAAGRLERRKN